MRSAFTSARTVSTERPRQYSHSAERFGASSLHIFYPASCSYLLVPAEFRIYKFTYSFDAVCRDGDHYLACQASGFYLPRTVNWQAVALIRSR